MHVHFLFGVSFTLARNVDTERMTSRLVRDGGAGHTTFCMCYVFPFSPFPLSSSEHSTGAPCAHSCSAGGVSPKQGQSPAPQQSRSKAEKLR